jgi:hypothetical protein
MELTDLPLPSGCSENGVPNGSYPSIGHMRQSLSKLLSCSVEVVIQSNPSLLTMNKDVCIYNLENEVSKFCD